MTKAKAAGYISLTNHVEAKQLVDGVERRAVGAGEEARLALGVEVAEAAEAGVGEAGGRAVEAQSPTTCATP